MTNQEYLSTLTAEQWYSEVMWLFKTYGKQYNDSYQAITEWLKAERGNQNDKK